LAVGNVPVLAEDEPKGEEQEERAVLLADRVADEVEWAQQTRNHIKLHCRVFGGVSELL
jgi:hypothetical protein